MPGSRRDVNQVPTWVEQRGTGAAHVLLLHGGFGSTDEWESSLWRLADACTVIGYDRRGHGRTPDVGEWDRSTLVDDAVALLRDLPVRSAHVVGYSDGGAVAAELVARHPELVASLTLISTGLSPGDWIALPPEPDPEDPLAGIPAEIVDAYERVSPDGARQLPSVAAKAAALSREEFGDTTALESYQGRAMVVAADDDLVELAGQLELSRLFPRGELAVVPGTSHDAPREKPHLILQLVRDFISDPPVDTHIPMRRTRRASVATTPAD